MKMQQWDNDTGFINGTNLSMKDWAANAFLVNLYTEAWDGANDALNQSGYLQNLQALNYGIGYDNKSLPSDTL